MNAPVVVIGAGLAGLSCARALHAAGIPVEVHEASDDVGGRVRTDLVEGFRLDRGFQVLLTAYPECQARLDYRRLELRAFYPGARIWTGRTFELAGDPLRRPGAALPTLFSWIGSFADKLRIVSLRAETLRDRWREPETTTWERLKRHGFSTAMIERFFRPFFGGIFLERRLATSSRMFDFVFRMMAEGDIAIPRYGMQAIPEQLAAPLPPGTVRLNSPVGFLAQFAGRTVVVATGGPAAAGLLDGAIPPVPTHGVHTLYFAAEKSPAGEPIIFLDGQGRGPVNNFTVLSSVSPDYAPPGAALCAASIVDSKGLAGSELEAAARAQLTDWFGPEVSRWQLLRSFFIPDALPDQTPPALAHPERPVQLKPGLYVCGDHRDNASLDGALASGRRAAQAIAGALSAP